jgi:cytochrome c oxidase cbb3-type subunit 3
MKNMFHRLTALGAVTLTPMLVFAQVAQAPAKQSFWADTFGSLALLGAAIVIIGALFAIVRLFNVIMKMEELRILKEKGVDEIVEAYRQPQESWWTRLMKAATKAVPVSQEQDVDLGHDYDGIRELDNRLPPWWLWLFYVTIIFSVIYWGVYHVTGSAPGLKEEYEKDMETAKAAVAAYVATQADKVDENSVVALTDPAELDLGKSIFTANCLPCHGAAGEGNTIGPNLTDEYWIHGGGIKNIYKTLVNGVIEKGMQSWKENLRPAQIQQVASYVLSLQGTNPPNAKAPQGEIWKETGGAVTPTAPAKDSTATGDAGHKTTVQDSTTLAK